MITEYMNEKATMTCNVCRNTAPVVVRRVGPSLGAYCAVCDNYIKWVKQDLFWRGYERATKGR